MSTSLTDTSPKTWMTKKHMKRCPISCVIRKPLGCRCGNPQTGKLSADHDVEQQKPSPTAGRNTEQHSLCGRWRFVIKLNTDSPLMAPLDIYIDYLKTYVCTKTYMKMFIAEHPLSVSVIVTSFQRLCYGRTERERVKRELPSRGPGYLTSARCWRLTLPMMIQWISYAFDIWGWDGTSSLRFLLPNPLPQSTKRKLRDSLPYTWASPQNVKVIRNKERLRHCHSRGAWRRLTGTQPNVVPWKESWNRKKKKKERKLLKSK